MEASDRLLAAPALRTRVAKRVFSLFLVCALAPVALFAIYAHLEVRDQLEEEAGAAIARDAKTAGMVILERLLVAEAAFRSLATVESGGELPPGLVELRRAERADLALEADETARLDAGDAVLRLGAASPPVIELFLPAPRSDAGGPVVVGRLDPDFVFVPERIHSGEQYWVEDGEGRLVFAVPDADRVQAMRASVPELPSRVRVRLEVGGEHSVATAWPLFLGRFGRAEWRVGMARPKDAVLKPLSDFQRSFPVFACLTVAIAVVASLWQIRRMLIPLDALSQFARELSAGDLAATVSVDSRDEFEDLGHAFNEMAGQIRDQVGALRHLNAIGQALSQESHVEKFLARALEGAAELTAADACALVLGDDQEGFEVARFRRDGRARRPPEESAQLAFVGACASLEGRTLQVDRSDAALQGTIDWEALGRAAGIEVQSFLAISLLADGSSSLGALVLLSRRPAHETFDGDIVDLAESLASQAAAALRQARNVETLRGLFEGLIHLTVRAIDEKSAYTGEHCRKVPILTEMIAEAACGTRTGQLKDFDLSEEEQYELRIAALLHDCGKVVTPVHVMDKATKLETLFDRIELVRSRFALVRRELEIEALQARGEDPARGPEVERELSERLARLDDDLAFIEWANRGRESMSHRDQSRVGEIARAWSLARPDGSPQPVLDDDEVMNLSISRGTLNDAERRIMEDHVVSTINLLEELPFPKELRNVPYIAGAHHEHVDGSGYPKGLGGDRLTMQARILGLADVFEALTAKTRPYKPGMTLSETLAILESMKEAGHIDPRLHELFLREKLYLRYAAEHLDPQQIDAAHWEDLERLTGSWEEPETGI